MRYETPAALRQAIDDRLRAATGAATEPNRRRIARPGPAVIVPSRQVPAVPRRGHNHVARPRAASPLPYRLTVGTEVFRID